MSLVWAIRYSDHCRKQIDKLPHTIAKRIDEKFHGVFLKAENPKIFAERVQGVDNLWRFRVGDHRVVCHIGSEKMVITAVAVEKRPDAYKKKQMSRLAQESDAITRGEGSEYPE